MSLFFSAARAASATRDPRGRREGIVPVAASIAGLMITTECVIADMPEDEKKGGGMPGGMGGGGLSPPDVQGRVPGNGDPPFVLTPSGWRPAHRCSQDQCPVRTSHLTSSTGFTSSWATEITFWISNPGVIAPSSLA